MFVKSMTSGNLLPAKIIKKSFIRKLFLQPYILIEYIGSNLEGKCNRTQWYKPSNIIDFSENKINCLIMRLKNLLPELNYTRETHRQWRDCHKKYRDKNPDIGNSEFHEKYVDIYDERISAIEEAMTFLQAQT